MFSHIKLLHRFDGVASVAQQLEQTFFAGQMGGTDTDQARLLGHQLVEFFCPVAVALIDKEITVSLIGDAGFKRHGSILIDVGFI